MKIIFINFYESPENLHFEQAFIRNINRSKNKNISFDILHDFDDYKFDFIPQEKNKRGWRIRYSSLKKLKTFLKPYNVVIFLDFLQRGRCFVPYTWLASKLKAERKIFIANHLMPQPADNPFVDLCMKLKILKNIDYIYIFNYCDKYKWINNFGATKEKIVEREYAVDCRYYSPQPTKIKNYIFSAGTACRNFKPLIRAIKKISINLKIQSDIKQPSAISITKNPRIQFCQFLPNRHNFKKNVLESKLVVIPIDDTCTNKAAPNSITFIAMALGKIILCRKTDYIKKFVKDGINGFTYDKLSALILEKKIKQILRLPLQKQKRIQKAARSTIIKEANLDILIKKILNDFLLT